MDLGGWKDRGKMYACWLCSFPDIGNGQLHQLSERFGGPEGVYRADSGKWGEVLSPKQVQRLKEHRERWSPEAERRRMEGEGIELLTMADGGYPERLREIPDPPYFLFVKGRLPSDDAPWVAVIGARECSEYGSYVAERLGETLGRRGVTVVSGMARGIDGISQEAALRVGGSSVGVLGSGADVCYPAQNRGLYERLAQSGALLSSYSLGTPARPQNFPPRNRIVSGLADAVVVVEARAKSGTLITVDMALEQGREVYVVPGRVTDRLSDGCNRLIKQGAGVLLSPDSFLEEIWEIWQDRKGRGGAQGSGSSAWPSEWVPARPRNGGREKGTEGTFSEKLEKPEAEGLSGELAEVYGVLDLDAKSPAEIAQGLGGKHSEKEIVMWLMELCMMGAAVQVGPGRFCCRRR